MRRLPADGHPDPDRPHRQEAAAADGREVAPGPARDRRRGARSIREYDPYAKLFEERVIFLGVQIDDASANDVM
ncbi:ATP-dependent Clp protease proteolytic subunit, partial [Streptomyces sp. NPDC001809]